jgi:nucleotide-binding universal stress UspA family protein
MGLRRILCCVDFSDYSVRAFKVAVDLARFFRADLRLLHIIEPNVTPADLMPVRTLDNEIMSVEQKAMRALERLIGEWGTGLQEGQVQAAITTGHARTEIVNYVRTYEIDLIVIGAKGFRSLEEVVMGGTAEQVVKQANCSVLVVRGD